MLTQKRWLRAFHVLLQLLLSGITTAYAATMPSYIEPPENGNPFAGEISQPLFLVNQPLATILIVLENRFGLAIEVRGSIDLTHRLTIYYHEPVNGLQILKDLCLVLRCSVLQTSGGFVLQA